MAVALGNTDEVRWLGSELQRRQCTFSPSGTAVAAADCTKPENKTLPTCIAGQDLTNLRYRDSVDIFQRAEAAKGDEQRLLYEQAASELVRAVNDEPNHPQAPLALEKAAIALERTSRFESAGRLYQRIIEEGAWRAVALRWPVHRHTVVAQGCGLWICRSADARGIGTGCRSAVREVHSGG
jgi:hypothetical protein